MFLFKKKKPDPAQPVTAIAPTAVAVAPVPNAVTPAMATAPSASSTPTPTTPAVKEKITSLLAKTARFEGNIRLAEGIKIDGVVIGDVEITGNDSVILLSEGGRIEGNVKAARVIIGGTVMGNVFSEQALLHPTAKVDGDIVYRMLKVADGAEINGKICRSKENEHMPHSNISPLPVREQLQN